MNKSRISYMSSDPITLIVNIESIRQQQQRRQDQLKNISNIQNFCFIDKLLYQKYMTTQQELLKKMELMRRIKYDKEINKLYQYRIFPSTLLWQSNS